MKNIFNFLFSKFYFGAEALAESPIPQDVAEKVLSGLDAVVKQNGNIIGFATDVSIDENFSMQGIKTLGYHGDRGFKSTDYSCRFTVGSFMIRKGATNTLKASTRRTVLTDAPSEFELLDVTDGAVVGRIKGCRIDSKSYRLQAGQLVSKNTTWFAREFVPESIEEN